MDTEPILLKMGETMSAGLSPLHEPWREGQLPAVGRVRQLPNELTEAPILVREHILENTRKQILRNLSALEAFIDNPAEVLDPGLVNRFTFEEVLSEADYYKILEGARKGRDLTAREAMVNDLIFNGEHETMNAEMPGERAAKYVSFQAWDQVQELADRLGEVELLRQTGDRSLRDLIRRTAANIYEKFMRLVKLKDALAKRGISRPSDNISDFLREVEDLVRDYLQRAIAEAAESA